MTAAQRSRVAVIGGGVMGSAAAWALAKAGADVVLFEQFGPGHTNGASHGSSRIFRHAYLEQSYIQLAARSLTLWQELQVQSGSALLTLTSSVDHGPTDVIQAKAVALETAGIGHRVISPTAAHEIWPGMRFDTSVLVHDAAGRLHADRAVAALQSQSQILGGQISYHSKVLALEPAADSVTVVTAGSRNAFDRVVVAPGAWATDLLGDHVLLPALRTTQEQPAHFLPLDPQLGWPSFVHHPGSELTTEGIYGLGSLDGVKIGEHATGPEVHPDTRDFTPDPAGVARLVEYARDWLPGVDPASVAPLTCLYTCTPDHHFLLDRSGPLIFAAGFSGHGFKFGAVIGEILAGMALSGEPGPAQFRLDRDSLRLPAGLS